MKLKICHLTSAHSINDVRINKKECASLANNGFTVTLIACGKESFEKNENNIHLISLVIPVKNRVERIFKASREVYKEALRVDADIYHLHDPELIPYGVRLKKAGKKVIFDSHEDIPLDIANKKYLPKALRVILSKIYSVYEKKALKKFDIVISVTPHIVERLKTINPATFQITNYPILKSNYTNNKDNNDIKKESKPTLFFAGGISPLWTHENILKAIIPLNVNYIMAGPITDSYLKKLQNIESWNKVDYLGNITHDEVISIYKKSHIGLAILNYSESFGGKLGTLGNTKLFEIMAAGIPVICTDFILWKEIVEKNNIGICVNPSDIKSITNSINQLIANPLLAKEMGARAKKIAHEYYSWETQAKILVEIYNNI